MSFPAFDGPVEVYMSGPDGIDYGGLYPTVHAAFVAKPWYGTGYTQSNLVFLDFSGRVVKIFHAAKIPFD